MRALSEQGQKSWAPNKEIIYISLNEYLIWSINYKKRSMNFDVLPLSDRSPSVVLA